MVKQATGITVGIHNGQPGISVNYADEPNQVTLFGLTQALQIGKELVRLAEGLQYTKAQLGNNPGQFDPMGISDSARVELQGGDDEAAETTIG